MTTSRPDNHPQETRDGGQCEATGSTQGAASAAESEPVLEVTQGSPAPQVLVVHPARCREHVTGPGHPEAPARMDAVAASLRMPHLSEHLRVVEPDPRSHPHLEWVHDVSYLERARHEIEAGRPQLSTGDTVIGKASWEIAQLAASAVTTAVEAVMTGQTPRSFCAVRPPGHHASQRIGMGFCILNNVALGVRHAQRRHGVGKVAIVDWDVHHGNGTQDIFYEDGSVLFFSTHQFPWYPGTGRAEERGSGAGLETTLNVPLPAYSGRTEVFAAFEDVLLPALADFRPELIFVSAGFDSRRGDPLGLFQLEDGDFRDLTRMLLRAADDTADGRLVSVLEGGYDLSGLQSAVTAHLEALAGLRADSE